MGHRILRLAVLIAGCALWIGSVTVSAQDTPATPPPETAPAVGSSAPAIPAYQPLTGKEKVQYYFRHTYEPRTVLQAVVSAGINQWRDVPHEWGQGAEGFGRRFASSYGQHIIKDTVSAGVGAALHEDPRYFPSGEHGFWTRTKYAIKHTYVTRKDDGSETIYVGRLAGTFAGAGLSRLWWPSRFHDARDVFESAGINMAGDIGYSVFREFWSSVRHKKPGYTAGP